MESKLFHSASILHVIIEVFFSFFIHPHRKDLEDFVSLESVALTTAVRDSTKLLSSSTHVSISVALIFSLKGEG